MDIDYYREKLVDVKITNFMYFICVILVYCNIDNDNIKIVLGLEWYGLKTLRLGNIRNLIRSK